MLRRRPGGRVILAATCQERPDVVQALDTRRGGWCASALRVSGDADRKRSRDCSLLLVLPVRSESSRAPPDRSDCHATTTAPVARPLVVAVPALGRVPVVPLMVVLLPVTVSVIVPVVDLLDRC